MLVSCTKCESRYKLPDEKVRSSGTKVRCPRCQNTFYVFPETAPEVSAPKEKPAKSPLTRGFRSSSKKFKQKEASIESDPESGEATQMDEGHQFYESAKTMVSPPLPSKSSPPFKKLQASAKIAKADEKDDVDFHIDEKSEVTDAPQASEFDTADPEKTPPPARPFGDATFAEIQVNAAQKSGRKNIIIGVAVAVVLAIGYLLFVPKNEDGATDSAKVETPADTQTDGEPTAVAPTTRSTSWYKDDPSFLQDYLTQMAALPMEEQQRPENRGYIADALILNGLLIGADDQVITGMGYASSLVAAHPGKVYGLYGLTSYALLKEDIKTLNDLVGKWPGDQQSDPEFRLAAIIVEAKNGSPVPAFQKLSVLLREFPEFKRAVAWTLLLAIDFHPEAENVFTNKKLQEYVGFFHDHRKSLKHSFNSVPVLYQSLDKKLKIKGNALFNKKEPPAPKVEAPKEPPPAPKVVEPVKPPEPVAQVAPAPVQPPVVEPPPAPVVIENKPEIKAPAKTPEKKVQKGLPRPNEELVAINRQNSQSKKKAQKLFEDGNRQYRENKLDDAINLYQNALREDPDMAEVYKQLGIIYMGRKENERALRAFKIYLQLRPEGEDRQMVQGWISSMQ